MRVIEIGDKSLNGAEVRIAREEGDVVVTVPDAFRMAEDAGLDLVLVAEKSNPPVCRLLNYGKYLYQQSKAKKKNTKRKTKEIKFHVNVDKHDRDIKVNQIKKFISKGMQVRVMIQFRGREMAHKSLGFELMKEIIANFGEAAIDGPKMNGKQILTILN